MKKIIAALVLIVALIVGVFVATKDAKTGVAKSVNDSITETVDGAVGKSASAAIEQQIAEFIARNDIFETKSAKFYPGDSNSSGFIEGVVKKEKLQKSLAEGFSKLKEKAGAQDSNDTDEPDPAKIFPEDFAFRYDYTIKHSVKNAADGFESDGILTIKTPYYAEPCKKLFKTDAPLSTHLNYGPTEVKFSAKLADINVLEDGGIGRLAGLSLNGTSDMSGKTIKALGFKIGEIFIDDGKDSGLDVKDLIYEANFKNGIQDLDDNITKLFLNDIDFAGSTKELVVTVDKQRFVVVTDMSTEGSYRVKDGILNFNESDKAQSLKIADVLVRNIHLGVDTSFSAALFEKYLSIISNPQEGEKLAENKELFMKLLKDDMKINVNDFSFENSLGKKFAFNASALLGGYIDETQLFKRMSLDGKATINTTITDFLSPYDSLRDFAPMAEVYGSQFLKPDGDGVKMEFSFDKASNSMILNGKPIPLPHN